MIPCTYKQHLHVHVHLTVWPTELKIWNIINGISCMCVCVCDLRLFIFAVNICEEMKIAGEIINE